MPTWVALLRGVNVGGRNTVSMSALRTALAGGGFEDVRTYLQSGNVVARSRHRTPAAVAAAVHAAVLDCCGVDTPVVVRTPAQLRAVLEWNPFSTAVRNDPKLVHVLHLTAEPAADAVAAAVGADWRGDEVAVRGQDAILRYAESMHTSRLQYPAVLKLLQVDGTARNWRTVQALVELAG